MKYLIRILMLMGLVSVGLWGLGLALARRFEQGEGYPASDEFRIAAYWGGREFTSTSGALRSGWAVAVMGGISLDLRDCTLAPEGATITLRASAGGIKVSVPDTWRVEVHERVQGGEVQANVADPETLPAGAPLLRVDATAQGGGILISTKEEAPLPR